MNKIFRFFALLLFCACVSFQVDATVFKAHLTDGWYPTNPKKLIQHIKGLDAQAKEQFNMVTDSTKIRALIVPHAGYAYSGTIAASVYRLCSKNFFDRIIVLVPSHTEIFHGIAVPDFNVYRIPTGSLHVDGLTIKKLLSDNLFIKKNELFSSEHALEVQLPLVHYWQPGARIVPLIVGSLDAPELTAAAQKLASIITPKTLVIVSSDLTHYGARFNYIPFTDSIELRLRQLDSSFLLPLQYNKIDQFKAVLDATQATVCGRAPLEILMKLIDNGSLGFVATRLVSYGNSSAVAPDNAHIVSYAGLIVTQEKTYTLNAYEKRSLLLMARDVLTSSFATDRNNSLLMPVLTPNLERKAAVFVTLYARDGKKELRGCIGTLKATQPLYLAVADMVLSAAHDPRFEPVQKAELNSLSIEISVLTDPISVQSYRDIVLNKHGIILSVGSSTALFLPKVPKEYGFDLETTLQHLSEKAGLNKNAWQLPEAKFQVFEAIDFSDHK